MVPSEALVQVVRWLALLEGFLRLPQARLEQLLAPLLLLQRQGEQSPLLVRSPLLNRL